MIPTLSALVDNGKLLFTAPCDSSDYSKEYKHSLSYSDTTKAFRHALISFFPESPKANDLVSTLFTKPPADESSLLKSSRSMFMDKAKMLLGRLSSSPQREDNASISGYQQFCVLFHILFLRILRGRIPIMIQVLHHLMVGLLFGKFL